MDIMSALKYWRHSDDAILRLLCASILDRRLFKIQMSTTPFDQHRVEAIRETAAHEYGVSTDDVRYLVWTDSTTNHAYNPAEDRINILTSDGHITDIAQASDQFNITGLSEPVVKYYLCYPKGVAINVM